MLRRVKRLLPAGCFFLLLVQCGGDPAGPGTGVAVQRIDIIGRQLVRVGELVEYRAIAYNANDAPLITVPFTWSSSDTTIAVVSLTGGTLMKRPGAVTIRAAGGGAVGQSAITVTVRPADVVVIEPALDSLEPGATRQLLANVRDSAGQTLMDRPIVWRSSDPARATVSMSGLVSSLSSGTVAITAEVEGKVGGAFITIRPPVARIVLPDTLDTSMPLKIVPVFQAADGSQLPARAAAWTSLDPAIAQVSNEGLVTPQAPGHTSVIASCCSNLADTMVVAVREVPAASVNIELPSNPPLFHSQSIPVIARVRDAAQHELLRDINWRSLDSTIVRIVRTVSPERVELVGVSTGTTMIEAVSGSAWDTAIVEVHDFPDTMRVEPAAVAITPGASPLAHAVFEHNGSQLFNPFVAASWISTDTSVVTVQGRDSRSAQLLARGHGSALVIGETTLHGILIRDTVAVTVQASSNVRLEAPPVLVPHLYTQQGLLLKVRDSTGAILATGVDISVTSSDTSIVRVTAPLLAGVRDTATAMLATGRPGAATITSRAGAEVSTTYVQVGEPGIIEVSLDLRAPDAVELGDTVDLPIVTLKQGQPQRLLLRWTSSDTTVATFSAAGKFQPRALGRTRVTVTASGRMDSATVTVVAAGGPVITTASPALWIADSVAVLQGSGFAALPAGNQVTVDAIAASVVAASATRLDLRLAPTESYPCQASHRTMVTARTGNQSAAVPVLFAPARQRQLTLGETVRLSGSAVACNELVHQAGHYLVSIVNEERSAFSNEPFLFRGAAADSAVRAANLVPQAISAGSAQSALGHWLTFRSRAAHARIIGAGGAEARRLGSARAALAAAPRLAASVADSAGALVRFRIPRVDRPDFCATSTAVTARRAWRGTHIEIYEDVGLSLARTLDEDYAQLGREFDSLMYPLVRDHFGDPLVMDALLDQSSRISVLVSPMVNVHAAGFVVSCDFYPETVAPSSNTGETIYLFAADAVPTGFPLTPGEFWLWQARSVLMHEAKHVASFARRLAASAPFEELWLEEGSAVIAEELWARRVHGTTWKGNVGYTPTLSCEVRPDVAGCRGRPFAMINAFAQLYDYANHYGPDGPSYESHTPLGPVSPADGSFYGSSWGILRWSIDTYASNERAFINALSGELVNTGVANLEARTGRPYGALLADFLTALRIDDTADTAGTRSEHRFPGWDLRSVAIGMNADFPGSFVSNPFDSRRTDGPFQSPILRVRGGSAAMYLIQVPVATRRLLHLYAPDRASLGNLSVHITRIR